MGEHRTTSLVQGVLLALLGLGMFSCAGARAEPARDARQAPAASSQTRSPALTLMLNPGGHTASITRIVATADRRHLVTASIDKTIRVHDSATLREERLILGEIGPGLPGTNYALALSPDDRWLAAGGWLGTGEEMGRIRIFDFASGRVLRLLTGHMGPVMALSFSPDGRFLVSGGDDGTVRIWDARRDFMLERTWSPHSGKVNDVETFSRDGRLRIVSAGEDGKISLLSPKEEHELNAFEQQLPVWDIEAASDRIVACGSVNKILEFSERLSFAQATPTDFVPHALAFSPSGARLLAGAIGEESYDLVLNARTGFELEYVSPQAFQGSGRVVAFLGDDVAVSAGGERNAILRWHPASGKELTQASSVGRTVQTVGYRDGVVAIGQKLGTRPTPQRCFDVEKPGVVDCPGASSSFEPLPKAARGYSLSTAPIDRVESVLAQHIKNFQSAQDPDGALVVSRNGQEVLRLARDPGHGAFHRAYGLADNTLIVSGGGGGVLEVFDLQGIPIAKLEGHVDTITSVSGDQRWLVTGSEDQTVRFWDLDAVRAASRAQPQLKTLKSLGVGPEWLKGLKKQYPGFELKRETDVRRLFERLKADHDPNLYALVVPRRIRPVLSLFLSAAKEWVLWTEEGFYNATPGADRYVGWHVGWGWDRSAEFYSARQFRRFLYRPDVVRSAFERKSSRLAVHSAGLEHVTAADLIQRAPVDLGLEVETVRQNGTAELVVRLGTNRTHAPERISIYVNGAQQIPEAERALTNVRPGQSLRFRVPLEERTNSIRAVVENKWAETSAEARVNGPLAQPMRRRPRRLFVTAIGVTKYPNLPPEKQLVSPAYDAGRIVEMFRRTSRDLYDEVRVSRVDDTGGDLVTTERVSATLMARAQEPTADDTSLVFLAGHAWTNPQGEYEFATADTVIRGSTAQGEPLEVTNAFTWRVLHQALDRMLGKRIVIVDTCGAGKVFKENTADLAVLAKDIHDVNSVVLAGSTAQEASLETDSGGLFTEAIVRGLEGGARYDGPFLTAQSLADYVESETPRLTRQVLGDPAQRVFVLPAARSSSQHPVAVVPSGMEDFVIYAREQP